MLGCLEVFERGVLLLLLCFCFVAVVVVVVLGELLFIFSTVKAVNSNSHRSAGSDVRK